LSCLPIIIFGGISIPRHSIHRAFERAVLGRSYGDVDRAIDLVGIASVRGHRRYLHTPAEAFAVGYAMHGLRGGASGLLHVLLDYIESDMRKKIKINRGRR
jgi:hypothetical protein